MTDEPLAHERTFLLEGRVTQKVWVVAQGKTLAQAVANAAADTWDLEEAEEVEDDWTWSKGTKVEVLDEDANWVPYEPEGEEVS